MNAVLEGKYLELQDAPAKISEIVDAYPEIHEMDLNPVIAHESGLSVVDARILLRRDQGTHRSDSR